MESTEERVQTLDNNPRSDEEEEEEEEDEEIKVKEMAELIRRYRSTLPNRLTKAFSSLLVAQRPILHHLPSQIPPETRVSGDPSSDAGDGVGSANEGPQDREIGEKMQSLKLQISRNAAAMPVVLKRMNDCIAKIDKLDSFRASIPSTFKRKKNS
ncbi:hypothetical protein Syun_013139 [Stephania yunnanensis]|uniref:Uncharacterized protein n=1 Tax=Stephania yunnanensis TaxID=152371 RepID=A0AAP0PI98_9MAGN